MNRRAQWAIVHGVSKSQMWLSDWACMSGEKRRERAARRGWKERDGEKERDSVRSYIHPLKSLPLPSHLLSNYTLFPKHSASAFCESLHHMVYTMGKAFSVPSLLLFLGNIKAQISPILPHTVGLWPPSLTPEHSEQTTRIPWNSLS